MESYEQIKRDVETLTKQLLKTVHGEKIPPGSGIIMASDTIEGRSTILVFADHGAAKILYEAIVIADEALQQQKKIDKANTN